MWKIVWKICPLRGHILIARLARSSRVWARLGRAIWSSRFTLRSSWTSRSVLCSSHTFKFISYNLILKLKLINFIIILQMMWITHFLKVTQFLFELKWNRKFNLLKALSALRNTFSSWRSRFALDFLYTFQ